MIGLVYYRRYFATWRLGRRLERDDLEKIFSEYDIILPKKTTALLSSVMRTMAIGTILRTLTT